MAEKDRVYIFDTTLRDGEQAPGASMTTDDKIRIATLLDRMGVDVIEAGFPVSSAGEFDAVNSIAKLAENSIIAGLSRAARGDIDACAQALRPAKRKRIHTFISTSSLHMAHKLQMTPDQVYDAVIDSVSYARRFSDDVEWSCEDGTRSDPDFLCRCFEAAIRAGATTVNIADTVGFTMPEEFTTLISGLMNRVPNIDKARFSVHCHDDLGMAVANSLAAIGAGVRQVECTINGIGERAGNAALEEIVMALRVRRDLLGCHTNVRTEFLTEASQLVSAVSGFLVPPNKSVVGANAFAHESGIHQHGVMQNRETYEIFEPATVGVSQSTIVMGKHSGRHAFRMKTRELGYDLGDNAIEDAFTRFKAFADGRKVVTDDEIRDIVDERYAEPNSPPAELKSILVHTDSSGPQVARLQIIKDGRLLDTEAHGEKPIDAIIVAIRTLLPHSASLISYQTNLAWERGAAIAKATVRLSRDGREIVGQAKDEDAFTAFAEAYLVALSKVSVPA